MTKTNFTTQTHNVRNEDLSAFHKAAAIINAFGENVHAYSIADADPAIVKPIHTYKKPVVIVQGSTFVLNEEKAEKSGRFAGQTISMAFIDSYDITDDCVKLHNHFGNVTFCFMRNKSA